jgi:hypothetical protein
MRGRWFHMSMVIHRTLLSGRSGKNEMCWENGEDRTFKTHASSTLFCSPGAKVR